MTLCTVTNVKEICVSLGDTYLFIRVRLNPLAHGIGWSEMVVDFTFGSKQRSLVIDVACPSEYENIIARN